MKTDFLIIGSGIAGLSYAYKVAMHFYERQERITVTIITKDGEEECNTKYAQGGIAVVTKDSDSFEQHIKDTLIAGAEICNKEVVRTVVKEAPDRIQELIRWGTHFDKNKHGEFDLAKEGGHSNYRILHFKDVTGNEIERALIAKVKAHPFITILNHHFAIDLITQHHFGENIDRQTPHKKCFGAYVLDRKTNHVITLSAKITLLATGGMGQVYATTTNPLVATGDGIAMAYRAKAIIRNMEFVQFHPTALYDPIKNTSFLISEAIRGAGAILKNKEYYAFMQDYDKRKDLAPRDIVARAIDSEMKKSGIDYVYLDATHISCEKLKTHFPTIYKQCLSLGIDISHDYIPVAPAAHYLCGGIQVNLHAQTSIKDLYASGECSYTGLHGANRLASNSLTEALVYSHRAYLKGVSKIHSISHKKNISNWNEVGTAVANEEVLISQAKKELQNIVSNYVGIVRSNERLLRASNRLKLILEESEQLYKKSKLTASICELRNLRSVAYLITEAAKKRKKNIGLHFNIDHS